MTPARCGRHGRGLAAALAGGVALGAGASVTSALGSPYGPFAANSGEGIPWLEYLSAWWGSAWAWGLFAFAVGWSVAQPARAVILATAGLVTAVLAYYVSDLSLGVNASFSAFEALMWALVAVVVGPVMALLGVLASRPAPWSLLPGLTAPTLMVTDALLRPAGSDRIRDGVQLGVLILAALLTLVLVIRGLLMHRYTPTGELSSALERDVGG